MISKEQKNKIIQKYATKQGDTGSPQVQIALLSHEIQDLGEHLKTHKKDFSSRRGLLRKVGQRRRLLRYLKKENKSGYEQLIKALKLKDSV
ncbi:MAG: 30S ribosomal protein S15 [Candidatus Kerfeldbacteria bacterium]|nr:30S ribosomal protein S15 [Candidatus Kerfeldbacteria bacterium]